MKRLTAFFVLFLTALCFALTASAAGDAIHSVTIDGNAVTVSLTAQSDCALWVAAYGADCGMIEADSVNLNGERDEQTMALRFGNIPTDAYAKAFLLDVENFSPLTPCGDTRNPSDEPGDEPSDEPYASDVYAILYADNTLVFQHGNTPQAGREVKNTYAVDMAGSYSIYHDNAPWDNVRDAITKIEFADKIQPKSVSCWFSELHNLTHIERLENLDTSHITDMSEMFRGCTKLAALDLSAFDTSNVTTMGGAATVLGMFTGCSSLKELDLSSFDTSNVTNMNWMFCECSSLEKIVFSRSFDTSKVMGMYRMFENCSSLTELDVSHFDTRSVGTGGDSKYDGMMYMFAGCSNLKELDLSNFDTHNVKRIDSMFQNCSSLTRLDLSSFTTENIWIMEHMFNNCSSLTRLDLSSFDAKNVWNTEHMFDGCANLIQIDVSDAFSIGANYDANDVEIVDEAMFAGCTSLVGGNGTKYDESHTDKEYARIDGGPSNPGYFTAK